MRMSFDEFCRFVRDNILEYMPEDFKGAEVTIRDFTKPTTSYKGLSVRRPGEFATSSVNLDLVFDDYQTGVSLPVIMEKIGEIAQLRPELSINEDWMNDYEKVKKNLFVRVSNGDNDRLTSTVPYKNFADLIITFHVAVDFGIGASFMITNDIMKIYGVSVDQLFDDAMENAVRMKPAEFHPIGDFVQVLTAEDDLTPPIIVASNGMQNCYGAAVITYPGFFEEAEKILKGSFYLLPSSIHEFLLIKADEATPESTANFKDMVYAINRTEVAPEDRLSDSVYFYDAKTRWFSRLA